MQEKDVISNEYFKDAKRFSDLLNGFIFSGQEVIKPENVQELDAVQTRIWRKDGKTTAQMMIRDVFRKVHLGMRVVLVSLENQSDIHYAMPVRVMNVESANYDAQVKKIKRHHREKKDLKGAEYLSGIAKADRLLPVVTIVLYYGKEEWDGPCNLKDMLELSDISENFSHMIQDYSINLLEIRKYPCLEHFHTDIRYVFGFLQNAGNSKQLGTYMEEHQEDFNHLDETAYDLISAMSHSEELQQYKTNHQTREGGYNMCQAIKDMIESGVQRGIAAGIETGIQTGMQSGIKIGEAQGFQTGEAQGIQLAKQVFQLSNAGKGLKEIAKECGITQKKVRSILG